MVFAAVATLDSIYFTATTYIDTVLRSNKIHSLFYLFLDNEIVSLHDDAP